MVQIGNKMVPQEFLADCSLINYNMVEAEETDEGLQSIRLCPLGVHCLRESQEQKTPIDTDESAVLIHCSGLTEEITRVMIRGN